MKTVSIDVSNRYIRLFGGYHDDAWIDCDKKHIKREFYLVGRNKKRIAIVDIGNKPLPKSTLIGYLIALATGASV